jgi:hypothetical protein
MPDRFLDLRKEGYKSLRIEIEFSLSFAIRPRMSQIPTVAPRRNKGSQSQHMLQ